MYAHLNLSTIIRSRSLESQVFSIVSETLIKQRDKTVITIMYTVQIIFSSTQRWQKYIWMPAKILFYQVYRFFFKRAGIKVSERTEVESRFMDVNVINLFLKLVT